MLFFERYQSNSPRRDSYEKCDDTIHDEQPLPTEKATNTAQLQKPASHQSTDGTGNILDIMTKTKCIDRHNELLWVLTWTPQNHASRVASSVLL